MFGRFLCDVRRWDGFIALRAVQTTPTPWTVTFAPGENTREVALVDEAAELGNVRQRAVGVA
jgi:hypothetical protein